MKGVQGFRVEVEIDIIVSEAVYLLGPHSYLYGLEKLWKDLNKIILRLFETEVMIYLYVYMFIAARS